MVEIYGENDGEIYINPISRNGKYKWWK